MFDVMGMAGSPEGQAFLKQLTQQFQSGANRSPEVTGSSGWQPSAQQSSLMDQGFNPSAYNNAGFQSQGMAPPSMPSTGMVGTANENFGDPSAPYDPSNDIARGQMIRQGGRGGGQDWAGYGRQAGMGAFMNMPALMRMSMSSRSQARRQQEQQQRAQQLQASSPGLLGRQPRQGGLLGMGASGAYQRGLRQR